MARQRGTVVPWQYEVLHSAQGRRHALGRFSAGMIDYDGHAAVLGTAIYVTEQKAHHRSPHESERRFRAP